MLGKTRAKGGSDHENWQDSVGLPFAAALLLADFSYQETSKVTGGRMAGALKVAGVLSKQAREPIRTSHFLKGNRMARLSQNDGEIVDLDKQTITHLDFQRKTYSVITFAEMAEWMKAMQARMAAQQGEQTDVTVRASVDPTSQTKMIGGLEARLVRIRVEMEGTDKRTGKRGIFMMVTTDQWIGHVPGYEEIKSFYRYMAERVPWAPRSGELAAGGAEMATAMAELQKNAAALDGIALYQVTRLHMTGAETAEAGEVRARESRQSQEQPSIGGALGRLGGLGRLGRLGRKKETAGQPPAAETAPAAQSSEEAVLMELTSEASGFSNAPVDPSRFEIPAGFKQVKNELKKALRWAVIALPPFEAYSAISLAIFLRARLRARASLARRFSPGFM
ncbi:MAG: hypothetical protein ACP5U2_10135 [Bryobacteraceae bacterium]